LSKGMFCSQLAAAALKRLNVLPRKTVSDNYLPGTLSAPNLEIQKHVKVQNRIFFFFFFFFLCRLRRL
jgi:hypothetical protein